ncbi:MAG: short chain enoyl-CoA hydratase [Actinomycetia bacterium]|nr:short chain enoyl-CoA hydratase [Actinomycetes bacterium]
MRTDYTTLLVNVDGPVVEVVLNRPEKRNAINFEMDHELDDVLTEAALDDDVRAVMVRGAGACFSAGHDLADQKELAAAKSSGERHPEVDPLSQPRLMRSWYFPKPLIAGVHGFVGPEALKIISHFDFVLAAPGTRFSYEQARIATSAPGGTALPFLLPMRVWKKLILMGGWFDAEQALDFHFVQRIVPEEELPGVLREWAEYLAAGPIEAMKIAKMGIHRQYELMGMANMEMVQNRIDRRGTDMASWDASGGVAAAVQQRDAVSDPTISKV